jgi:hypothetical protein
MSHRVAESPTGERRTTSVEVEPGLRVTLTEAGADWRGETIWTVVLDGEVLGTVKKGQRGWERRSPGKRYVTTRGSRPCWYAMRADQNELHSPASVSDNTRKDAILYRLLTPEVKARRAVRKARMELAEKAA